MSPALAFLGISILGTWGLASIGLIVGGIIMLVAPGDPTTSSDATLGGIVLIVVGLTSGGLMQLVLGPLLGLDPPLPMKAKNIIPVRKMTKWAKAGNVRDFTDGLPKEVRLRTQRVLIVRNGDTVTATTALCSHARLPLGGFPGSPIKAVPLKDGCIECPFHGARFDATTGKSVRKPFDSAFNNDHPLLGGLQSKLMFWNKGAEDIQTYPVRIEGGEIEVCLPK